MGVSSGDSCEENEIPDAPLVAAAATGEEGEGEAPAAAAPAAAARKMSTERKGNPTDDSTSSDGSDGGGSSSVGIGGYGGGLRGQRRQQSLNFALALCFKPNATQGQGHPRPGLKAARGDEAPKCVCVCAG